MDGDAQQAKPSGNEIQTGFYCNTSTQVWQMCFLEIRPASVIGVI